MKMIGEGEYEEARRKHEMRSMKMRRIRSMKMIGRGK